MLVFFLIQEVLRLQREADEANKHSSVLERDNQRCELQLSDMAQQVGSFSFIHLFTCFFFFDFEHV